MILSPAKTAEPIEVVFGLWSRVGPKNRVLDGVQIPQRKGAILRGEMAAHSNVQGYPAVICAKTAVLIEMQFGMRSQVGPGNHMLDRGEH